MAEQIFMSPKATASALGLPYRMVLKHIKSGFCPHITNGSRFLINVPRYVKKLENESEVSGGIFEINAGFEQ